MNGDWHALVGFAIGLVIVFVVVMVLTLRFSTRRQAQVRRNTSASDVLAAMGLSSADRTHLLYGVWETTWTGIILHVRDGNDSEVASVAHRAVGATITIGTDQYTVVVTSGWRESAVLLPANDPVQTSTPLCKFERRGWSASRWPERRCSAFVPVGACP